MTGLQYKNRQDGLIHDLAVTGTFVQIGLLPNPHWLDGVIARNAIDEIKVNEKGETNIKGIFAAGDCTTMPYKQIIIAAGEGAKASLSASIKFIAIIVAEERLALIKLASFSQA